MDEAGEFSASGIEMKIFISHSHEDRQAARELINRLADAGYEAWSHDWNVFPGDNYAALIGEALERSNAMVVLLPPEVVKTQHVRRELQFTYGSLSYEHRVIPVVVRPTDDIPWLLKKFSPLLYDQGGVETSRQIIERLRVAVEVAG